MSSHDIAPELQNYTDFTENSEFCWKCQALLNSPLMEGVVYKPPDPSYFGPFAQSRSLKTEENLVKTANEGCRICQRLMHYMSKGMQETLRNMEHEGVIFKHSLNLSETQLGGEGNQGVWSFYAKSTYFKKRLGRTEISSGFNLHLENGKLQDLDGENCSDVVAHYGIEVDNLVNRTEVASSTAELLTLSLVKTWIETCNQSHEHCIAAKDSTDFVPDRVIDITSERLPRLLVGARPTEVTQFTSLSHCWGSKMPLKLLSGNIEAFQREIPYSSLSKTYQDAIKISRHLGINHIWIDSLCILQDSDRDWQEQSAKMHMVYSRAHCNIAAAHASDGSEGCFANREPNLIRPLKVHLQWGRPGSYYAIRTYYQQQNIGQAPLHMRAWVFQERTLARRNLFFCETEVFFQCRELVASETFPKQLPLQTGVRLGGIYAQPTVLARATRPSIESDPLLYAYSMWDWLIEDFSSGRLTYATDKLVAISAVAREMQKHIRSEYLAGLWRQHLPYQLLWKVQGIRSICAKRPAEYIAPTWSWASTNGSVQLACGVQCLDQTDIIIDIVDVKVNLVNEVNPFGQVNGGYITIKGYLVSGYLHLSGDLRLSWRVDVRLQFGLSSPPFGIDVNIDNENDMREFAGKEVFFLPVEYDPDRNPAGYDQLPIRSEIAGLVLRQLSQSNRQYARIGMFRVWDSKAFLNASRSPATDAIEARRDSGEWGQTETFTIL